MSRWSIQAMAGVAALAAASAGASPYFEAGDAGQSLLSAQAVGAGVDVIHGNVGSSTADMFSFYWAGGAFEMNTFGSTADTQLFLFNAAGQGVWANDQASAGVSASQIIDPALAAGLYYVGVSVFDYDPYSSLGAMFPSAPFTGQFAAQNAGVLDHWAPFSGHMSATGDYVINFSAATSGELPEPPTLAVMAVAALAALWAGHWRPGNLTAR